MPIMPPNVQNGPSGTTRITARSQSQPPAKAPDDALTIARHTRDPQVPVARASQFAPDGARRTQWAITYVCPVYGLGISAGAARPGLAVSAGPPAAGSFS